MREDFLLEKIKKAKEKRLKIGEEKYGKFVPSKDSRDFIQMIFEEVIDALNYLDMYYKTIPSKPQSKRDPKEKASLGMIEIFLIEICKEIFALKEEEI